MPPKLIDSVRAYLKKQGNLKIVLLFKYKGAILPVVHEKGEIRVHEQTRT